MVIRDLSLVPDEVSYHFDGKHAGQYDRAMHAGGDIVSCGVYRPGMSTDWVSVGASILGGAVGGSLVSLFTVRQIALRTEQGRRRHEALVTLHGVLSQYRSLLRHDHSQPAATGGAYPEDYASLAGQRRLAVSVLTQLPHLGYSRQQRLREALERLVGPATIATAEALIYLPETERQSEENRTELAERRILLDKPERPHYGQLGHLRATQNEPTDHRQWFTAVLQTLDTMITNVNPWPSTWAWRWPQRT